MTELEQSVVDAIDLDGLVETLSELIAFESCDGREVEIQQHVARLLEEIGMETDVWEIDIPALERDPFYSAEIERARALGVVGTRGGDRGPTLILNGHVDVVPAGQIERWTTEPFRAAVRDGRVYGRGAADTKGGLSCAIHAVRALTICGVELHGSVTIQSVAGEEDGGLGTLAAIVRGHTGDGAIVLEPTQLIVAPAQAGALSFRITIPGKAAHGALRTEGVDPLEKFGLIFDALRGLERRRNERLRHPLFADTELPYPICVGRFYGGVWASTVAEAMVLQGRYGVGVGESCDDAREELENAIATAAKRDPWLREQPPTVEWWGARFEPAGIPADDPLVTTLSDSLAAITGQTTRIQGMPYGADMNLLVNRGKTPAVIFGPGDVRTAHAPDESVPIAELEAATKTLALTILRFCRTYG
ncbi:MAG: ArgE/DapE family deacylase [Acidobacteria bacterium]|nr:ArgE/DapE family deacylase [Acidobacteriota bacterium]